MEAGVPNKVINRGFKWPSILSFTFNPSAEILDLESCERVRSGFAKAVWELICASRGYEEKILEYHREYPYRIK
jgi:hypothetical protein